jgi:hypothetical protein
MGRGMGVSVWGKVGEAPQDGEWCPKSWIIVEIGVSQYVAARTIMAMCCAALAIQFHSGDPDLLLASWGRSDSTVETGEEERVEDIFVMRSEVEGM